MLPCRARCLIPVFPRQLVGRAQVHDDIGLLDLGPGALDADLLDGVVGVAQAGSVDEVDGYAFDADLLDDAVAGGAGNGGDDGDFGAGQGVEQAGLADVGCAGEHDVQALAQAGTALGGVEETPQGVVDARQAPGSVGFLQEVDFFFGEVEGGLDQHAQGEQLFGQIVNLPREDALKRSGGGSCGLLGAGFDEVGDGFGLHEVELVVQEGAFGELAGLGQADAEGSTHLQHAAQQDLLDDGAAVALQLQDVFAGVGMGGREPERQAVVDGLGIGRQKGAIGGLAGDEAALRAEDVGGQGGDDVRLGRRDAHDTDGALARGGGNGADGAFVLHGVYPKKMA